MVRIAQWEADPWLRPKPSTLHRFWRLFFLTPKLAEQRGSQKNSQVLFAIVMFDWSIICANKYMESIILSAAFPADTEHRCSYESLCRIESESLSITIIFISIEVNGLERKLHTSHLKFQCDNSNVVWMRVNYYHLPRYSEREKHELATKRNYNLTHRLGHRSDVDIGRSYHSNTRQFGIYEHLRNM